ncbi:MAG TPA: hypothetical protein VF880_19110 [Actinomycetes bacterium]
MILDDIDGATPEQLAAGVHELLLEDDDLETWRKLRDRRLLPALTAIVAARGRPAFAPADLPEGDAERVAAGAAHLLGEVARPEDADSVAALTGALREGGDRLRTAAATALGEIGATEAAGPVTAFTEEMIARGELGVVARMARALARIGDEAARDRLRAWAAEHEASGDQQVRYVVAQAEGAVRSIDERLA